MFHIYAFCRYMSAKRSAGFVSESKGQVELEEQKFLKSITKPKYRICAVF